MLERSPSPSYSFFTNVWHTGAYGNNPDAEAFLSIASPTFDSDASWPSKSTSIPLDVWDSQSDQGWKRQLALDERYYARISDLDSMYQSSTVTEEKPSAMEIELFETCTHQFRRTTSPEALPPRSLSPRSFKREPESPGPLEWPSVAPSPAPMAIVKSSKRKKINNGKAPIISPEILDGSRKQVTKKELKDMVDASGRMSSIPGKFVCIFPWCGEVIGSRRRMRGHYELIALHQITTPGREPLWCTKEDCIYYTLITSDMMRHREEGNSNCPSKGPRVARRKKRVSQQQGQCEFQWVNDWCGERLNRVVNVLNR